MGDEKSKKARLTRDYALFDRVIPGGMKRAKKLCHAARDCDFLFFRASRKQASSSPIKTKKPRRFAPELFLLSRDAGITRRLSAARDPGLGGHPEQKRSHFASLNATFYFSSVSQKQAFSSHSRNKKPSAKRRMDFFAQSGCRDLNPGPLAPQTSTLTGLSYIPLIKEVQK